MKRKTIFLLTTLLFCSLVLNAQDQKSALQQKAEAAAANNEVPAARYTYIRAYEDYTNKGQIRAAIECGTKAVALYYKENYYQEGFDLLRRLDQTIVSNKEGSERSALQYLTTKERLQMYLKMHRSPNVFEQLNNMEVHATASGQESLKNDLLYQKAICYYTFGQNAKGDAAFKEMSKKLTATGEYDKVDAAYQALIANGRKSGSAGLVAQSYRSYIAWKDSANALKVAAQIDSLEQHIADNETVIADKDSSLSARMATIIGLSVLAAALAIALVLGALVLMRYIFLTRKQKNIIRIADENNALKAKFISNISAQMKPTLQKLDASKPEVKALLDFAAHVETLSDLENATKETIELEEVQVAQFCEGLMDQIRAKAPSSVTLTVDAPKMGAKINKEYVSHILLHLLNNAVEYVADGGKIVLEFRKRSAHSYHFLVWNTGNAIPEEKREDIFKPFLEIHDLTTGDGLGLPICKKMAMNMDGDLYVDSEFSKGARFILSLHE